MGIVIDVFKLLAGIGLFLFATYLLEESLKNLSGRNFKIFLQRITKNRIGAVAGGAIATGFLQSSSMVSVMVLAFVGAGVFTMKNALAIILGANLGTTLANWAVATLGFKVNIEVASYPAVCLGGLLLVIFSNRKTIKYISFFLLGFGLLFIALSFMKAAMESHVEAFDLKKYIQMSPLVFMLIGFIITLLIQSSSVTMALTLSAVHAGAITFAPAAAIVLGSETGTTIKILLGSVGGTASKKRVALGNFLFNVFLTLFAFALLTQILFLITDIFKIKDPLIELVTFSSLVNLLSILIILPFLNAFARLLERFFKDSDAAATAFIISADINEPQTALDLFQKETEYFIHNSMLFNLFQFEIKPGETREHPDFHKINMKRKFYAKTQEEKYELLKQQQGELQAFYLELRAKLPEEKNPELSQLIAAVRNSMYSVKCINDISRNIANLSRSSKDVKYGFFMHHKKGIEEMYRQLNELTAKKSEQSASVALRAIFDKIQENYSSSLHDFYKQALDAGIEDLDITTALNFNRELFSSNKAMLMAVKDYLLSEKEAENFNHLEINEI